MAGRWELTDEQWEVVEPILRPARRERGLLSVVSSLKRTKGSNRHGNIAGANGFASHG